MKQSTTLKWEDVSMGSMISIGGVTYTGRNITVNNGQVIVDGVIQGQKLEEKNIIINADNFQGTLKCGYSTVVNGNIGGDVESNGSVTCDGIGGSVSAGGSVRCDDVKGNVSAGGSVNCGNIGGSAMAGGSIKHR
ncbi:hypothetical protein ACQKIY_25340 [Bacillus mycoides]|uniref:hypothetical protein n=1 Tax=Bacillus mycoides TaxID=1405 RepID=UPI003D02089B